MVACDPINEFEAPIRSVSGIENGTRVTQHQVFLGILNKHNNHCDKENWIFGYSAIGVDQLQMRTWVDESLLTTSQDYNDENIQWHAKWGGKQPTAAAVGSYLQGKTRQVDCSPKLSTSIRRKIKKQVQDGNLGDVKWLNGQHLYRTAKPPVPRAPTVKFREKKLKANPKSAAKNGNQTTRSIRKRQRDSNDDPAGHTEASPSDLISSFRNENEADTVFGRSTTVRDAFEVLGNAIGEMEDPESDPRSEPLLKAVQQHLYKCWELEGETGSLEMLKWCAMTYLGPHTPLVKLDQFFKWVHENRLDPAKFDVEAIPRTGTIQAKGADEMDEAGEADEADEVVQVEEVKKIKNKDKKIKKKKYTLFSIRDIEHTFDCKEGDEIYEFWKDRVPRWNDTDSESEFTWDSD